MGLEEHLQSAKKSIFRFEYLQEFNVPEERELFRTYSTNGQVEIRHIMQDWWNFLETKHDQGVVTQRVRLIRFPLTKYLEWELYIHRQTIEHGDEIRILNERDLTPDLEQAGDFWLVDDAIALKMNYDTSGKYLGCEEVESHPYLKAKEYLLSNAQPI